MLGPCLQCKWTVNVSLGTYRSSVTLYCSMQIERISAKDYPYDVCPNQLVSSILFSFCSLYLLVSRMVSTVESKFNPNFDHLLFQLFRSAEGSSRQEMLFLFLLDKACMGISMGTIESAAISNQQRRKQRGRRTIMTIQFMLLKHGRSYLICLEVVHVQITRTWSRTQVIKWWVDQSTRESIKHQFGHLFVEGAKILDMRLCLNYSKSERFDFLALKPWLKASPSPISPFPAIQTENGCW